MQAIINGLRYDTEASTQLASNRYWDGHNWDRNGRNTFLYKTKNGRYFLHHTTRWQGERDSIEPIGLFDAKANYEALPEKDVDYADAFGIEPEDA
jgi:hypothetical protein